MYHNPNQRVSAWFRSRLLNEVERDAAGHGDSHFSIHDASGAPLVTGQVGPARQVTAEI